MNNLGGFVTLWSKEKLVGKLPSLGRVVDVVLQADEFSSSPITIRCIFVQVLGLNVGAQVGAFMATNNQMYLLSQVAGWREAQSLEANDFVE